LLWLRKVVPHYSRLLEGRFSDMLDHLIIESRISLFSLFLIGGLTFTFGVWVIRINAVQHYLRLFYAWIIRARGCSTLFALVLGSSDFDLWRLVDTFYFSLVTVSTLGFGNFLFVRASRVFKVIIFNLMFIRRCHGSWPRYTEGYWGYHF
jgi:hypothetical protein